MKNLMKNKETSHWKEEFAKRLITFSVDVLKFAEKLRKDPNLWSVSDQLVRSSTSVGANINEAKGAGSKKEFAHYFQIALKSSKETLYWFEVISQYDGKHTKTARSLSDEMSEISRIINSSLLTMKGKR